MIIRFLHIDGLLECFISSLHTHDGNLSARPACSQKYEIWGIYRSTKDLVEPLVESVPRWGFNIVPVVLLNLF